MPNAASSMTLARAKSNSAHYSLGETTEYFQLITRLTRLCTRALLISLGPYVSISYGSYRERRMSQGHKPLLTSKP